MTGLWTEKGKKTPFSVQSPDLKDLEPFLVLRNRVSDVLNRKRREDIPYESLIEEGCRVSLASSIKNRIQ